MTDLEIFENTPEDATPEELANYLDEACGSDNKLRAEVEGLLQADGRLGSFMGKKALGEPTLPDIDMEAAGSVIGDYRLLQEIGHGGFGTVYMADQLAPVKRRVALKIIKLGMDTKQVVARFEVERQALAMMDHPNIAKVLDAGATDSGRPYFVMELVRGIPITQFCDERKLDTKARLALFTDVCNAIQHAHQKGIIHRDLKPSNIIVALHDDKAVPKVIDFGVAKATQQDLTDKTLFTQFEQFIGTPAYMSPEQAQMSGLDIDTRSDIYALGVLLYELLTGTTPFESKTLAASGYNEMRRVISEDEPPKPSTRLTEIQTRTNSSAETSILRPEIDQDLDWIVMKALEKDRTRRYDTANGLAADIRRHLQNEPIEAAAPGAVYRLRKYVKRHRHALITIGSIASILILGSVMSTFFAVKFMRASSLATAKGDDAERRRIGAQLLFAEEQFERGKTEIGIAHLAKLIREDQSGAIAPIAAERLFSAVRLRELPELLYSYESREFEVAALSADGSKLVTVTLGGLVRVIDVPTGQRISPLMEEDSKLFISQVEFSASQDKILLLSSDLKGGHSQASIWDWQSGERQGDPYQLGSNAYIARISPDGKLLLIGCPRSAMIWNIETGERCFTDPITQTGYRAEFSPDSETVFFTHGRLHDARTGNVMITFPPGGSRSGKFNPDGTRLVTSSDDGAARVWDPHTGELVDVMEHGSRVLHAEYSPDGSMIATASWDGYARIWDATSHKLIAEFSHENELKNVRFSSDSLRLVATEITGSAHVWAIQLGNLGRFHYGKAYFRQKSRLSNDGNVMLVSGGFSDTRLWKAPVGQPRSQVFRHHKNLGWVAPERVWVANFSPDGERIVTAGLDAAARVWNAWTGERQLELPQSGWQWRAEFSSDGAHILTTGESSGVAVWDAITGQQQCLISGNGMHRHAAFRPIKDEQGEYAFVAAPYASGSAQVYNAHSGKSIGPPLTHHGPGSLHYRVFNNHRAMWSPDGMRVVTATDDGSARIWSWHDGKLLVDLNGHHDPHLESALFSPDGGMVVTTSSDGTAGVWDSHSGDLLHVLEHGEQLVSYAEFSPDGKRILTASVDGSVRIWNAKTWAPVGLTLQHESAVRMARFSPDGNRILTVSLDKTARVWGVKTGYALSEPLKHEGFVLWGSFSPDGNRVITSGDTTARIWDLPPAPKGPVPDWVSDWAEAIAGIRIKDNDVLTPVPMDERRRMQQDVLGLSQDGFYAKTAKWFYQDKSSRLITPFARLTVNSWVENRIKEDTFESLQEAIRVSPDHPVALAHLARALLKAPHRESPGNLLRARNLIQRAISLDSQNVEWQKILANINDIRATVAASQELNLLESRAERLLEAGDQASAQTHSQIASLGRILMQAEAAWPDLTLDVSINAGFDVLPQKVLSELSIILPHGSRLETRQRWLDALAKQTPSDLDDARRDYRLRVQALLGQWDTALETLDERPFDPANVRQRKEVLRHQAQALEAAGHVAESAPIRADIAAVPLRDPDSDSRMLDLTDHYTESLFRVETPAKDSAQYWTERLAETFQPGDGPAFDIRGAIQLNSGVFDSGGMRGKDHNMHSGSESPMEVVGIPVSQKAKTVHFLLRNRCSAAKLGSEVAHLTVHYVDGTSERVPLIYGVDMIDHWIQNHTPEELSGVTHLLWNRDFINPWNGTKSILALTRKAWQNPHPEKSINTIDFTSAGQNAAPQLIAITVE